MFDKNKWIGRTFQNTDDGTTVTLTEDIVYRGAFIPIGSGFIDLGDGFYMRSTFNIKEIKEESE